MGDQIFDGGGDSAGPNADDATADVAARYKLSPLTLTIFERENDDGTFYNAELQRAYTQDDGDSFEYTTSLRPRDLRKAARLLERAADDLQGFDVTQPGD